MLEGNTNGLISKLRIYLANDMYLGCLFVVLMNSLIENHKSRVMRKPTFWFLTWSDTNEAVQLQKIARGLKFRI